MLCAILKVAGEVRREMPQDAQLAWAQSLHLGKTLSIAARRRSAAEQVEDVGEKGAMTCVVTRQCLEQRRGFGHGKGEDQPVRLSGREGSLSGGSGGALFSQRAMRRAREQMGLHDGEGRPDARWALSNVAQDIQGRGGVPVHHADHGTCVVDGADWLGAGQEAGERRPRLVGHPQTRLCGCEPSRDPRRESVRAREQRLGPRRGCKGIERRSRLPAIGVQHARCQM